MPDIRTPNGFSSRSVGRRPLRQFTFARKVATKSDGYPIVSSLVTVLLGAGVRSIEGGTSPVNFDKSILRSKVKRLSSAFANTLHESAVLSLVVPCQDLTGCAHAIVLLLNLKNGSDLVPRSNFCVTVFIFQTVFR